MTTRGDRTRRLLGEIELERLAPCHLEDVAKLHYRLLPWSFNGQFGEVHIVELYKVLAACPNFFGYVYYRDGHLLGFVTATTNGEETRRRIVGVYRKRLGRMLRIFLQRPAFLLAALESKFIVPRIFRRFGTRAEWLTFVTDTTTGTLGPLVAMRLIEAVREHFARTGIACYMAQGFRDNPPAMKMYEKLGWHVVARLVMHNIYRYPTAVGEATSQ